MRARLLEEPGDFVVAAIPRQVGEAVAVERRPVRLRAGVEQDPRRFEVAFTHGQIDQGPMRSVPAAERGPAFEQAAQGRRVAGRGRRDGVADVALGVGVGLVQRGHNALII